MAAPKWHESAFYEERYQQVRIGVYAPIEVHLSKYDRHEGYEALAQVFSQISSKKSKANLEAMENLTSEYENRCFKDIDFNPVFGLFCYIAYKNFSKHTLELKFK